MISSNKIKALLFLAIILGLLSRIEAWDDYATSNVLLRSTDSIHYTAIAKNIIEGKGYAGAEHMLARKGEPTAFYGPTYPLFLALIFFIFGKSQYPVLIAHIILGLASIYLVYLLGVSLFGKNEVGIIAALIFAIIPQIIYYEFLLISETLFIFLILVFSLLLVNAFKKQTFSIWQFVGCGVLFGIIYLCRQVAITIPIAFFLSVYILRKDLGINNLKNKVIAFIVAAIIVVIPWAVRNYFTFSVPLLGTTTGQATLWWGTYEETGADLEVIIDKFKKRHPQNNEVEMARIMSNEAKQRLKAMSVDELLLIVKNRLRRFFGFSTRHFDIHHSQTISGILYVILFIGGIGGYLLAYFRTNNTYYANKVGDARIKLFYLMFFIHIWLTFILHMATLSVFRYIMPLVPFLCIGFSYLISWLIIEKVINFGHYYPKTLEA